MKTKLKLLLLSSALFVSVFFISSCNEDSTDPIINIDNPNVRSYDSIIVYEDSAAFVTRTGLNLLDGMNTVDTSKYRDCSLNDRNNTGMDFYLQNGELLKSLLPPGYETRFFEVSSNMSTYSFDTLSKVPGYVSFTPNDFTQNGTENWGYFNAPLSSYPVYCFWLKGKKDAGITANNVYGIIQPLEASDWNPSNVYGFRISFQVRINTNGENDFRTRIPNIE